MEKEKKYHESVQTVDALQSLRFPLKKENNAEKLSS